MNYLPSSQALSRSQFTTDTGKALDSNQTHVLDRAEGDSVSQLIGNVRLGCDRSRDELFQVLRSFFQTLAQRFHHQQLRSKLGVSDIVQQSMLRVVEKFDGFQGSTEQELKAWIKTLLINEIRQSTRSYSRKRRDVNRELSASGDETGPSLSFADPNPTPQSASIHNEQLASLKKTIKLLSENDQRVIQLRCFEQLSFEEIGQVTGRSTDAAAKLWYRAIVKLQRAMGNIQS